MYCMNKIFLYLICFYTADKTYICKKKTGLGVKRLQTNSLKSENSLTNVHACMVQWFCSLLKHSATDLTDRLPSLKTKVQI